jgi:hypothetical protein
MQSYQQSIYYTDRRGENGTRLHSGHLKKREKRIIPSAVNLKCFSLSRWLRKSEGKHDIDIMQNFLKVYYFRPSAICFSSAIRSILLGRVVRRRLMPNIFVDLKTAPEIYIMIQNCIGKRLRPATTKTFNSNYSR